MDWRKILAMITLGSAFAAMTIMFGAPVFLHPGNTPVDIVIKVVCLLMAISTLAAGVCINVLIVRDL